MWNPTEYFGERELPTTVRKRVANNLEFDDAAVDRISLKVFTGIDNHRTGVITQDDMRRWTIAIMAKKHPNAKFSEEMFQKGFARIDKNKSGTIDFEEIRRITLKKVKKENLYVSKKQSYSR